jgi:hypothetical protein
MNLSVVGARLPKEQKDLRGQAGKMSRLGEQMILKMGMKSIADLIRYAIPNRLL